eukprot:403339221
MGTKKQYIEKIFSQNYIKKDKKSISRKKKHQIKEKLQDAGAEVISYSHLGYLDSEGNKVNGLYHQFPMWLLHENDDLIKMLKNRHFDMLITEFHEFHEMFAKLFEHIPLYVFMPSHIEPNFAHRLKLQYNHGSHAPQNRVTEAGYSLDYSERGILTSLKIRFQNIAVNCYYYLSSYDRYINDFDRTHPTSKYLYENMAYQKRYPDLILISTLMGANNLAYPIAPNVKIFPNKYQQDISNLKFDEDLINFYNQYSKIMIATKGSRMDFKSLELVSFLNFTQAREDWGVVISIKDESLYHPSLIRALKNQRNINIQPYLNQPLLLAKPQTKILHCSGGKNSIYESASNGKVILISPSNILDQHYMCENIHVQQLGRCLLEKTSQELKDAIDYIEKNNFFAQKYEVFKKASQFEQSNEENYLFWIDYAFEQGLEHLQPNNFRKLSYTAGYEVDTHSLAYIMFLGSLVIIFSVLRKFIQYLKQYTSK